MPDVYDPQMLNHYSYCRNNPLIYKDPSGHIIETVWDVANVVMDAASFVSNVKNGNVGAAIVDGVALVVDAAATAVPGIPGGVGAGLKAYRAADEVIDAVKTVDKVVDATKTVDKVVDTTKAVDKALDTTKALDKTTDAAKSVGKSPGPTVDPLTGEEVGRFIGTENGPAMIEPIGGGTVSRGASTHTTYSNGSNYQRLDPKGHKNNPTPHGHGHKKGSGPKPDKKGQGPSMDVNGNEVKPNTNEAHWAI